MLWRLPWHTAQVSSSRCDVRGRLRVALPLAASGVHATPRRSSSAMAMPFPSPYLSVPGAFFAQAT